MRRIWLKLICASALCSLVFCGNYFEMRFAVKGNNMEPECCFLSLSSANASQHVLPVLKSTEQNACVTDGATSAVVEPSVAMAEVQTGPISIHGVVLLNNEPQANVRVVLNSGKRELFEVETVSNERGEYRFDHLPQKRWYSVTAQKQDYYGYEFVEVSSEEIVRNIDLQQGAFLLGRTVDEKGNPVPEVQVNSTVFCREAAIPTLVSDPEGYFRIPFPVQFYMDNQSKVVFFHARKGDLAGFSKEKINLSGLRRTAMIVMQPSATISGRILDEKNRPIANARVSTYPQGVESLTSDMRSDQEGRFRFEGLAPTTYAIAAVASFPGESGAISKEFTTVSLSSGQNVENMALYLSINTTSCGGSVIDANGVPICGATVQLHAQKHFINNENYLRQTDKRGMFFWNDAPLDEYKLTAVCEGYVPYVSEVPFAVPVNNIAITLVPVPEISGNVTEASKGTPIVNAQITVKGIDAIEDLSESSEVFSDSAGLFHTTHAGIGTLTIQVSAEGYASQTRTIEVTPGQHVADVTFAMEPNMPLSGVVLAANGRPVKDAKVECQNGEDTIESITNAAGCFSLSGIQGGEEIISVESLNSTSNFVVDLAMPPSEPLQLILPQSGQLKGTVSGADSHRLSASLNACNGVITEPRNVSVENGHFMFESIPTGKYLLRIRNGSIEEGIGAANYMREVTILPGQTSHVNIILQRGETTMTGTCRVDGICVRDASIIVTYLNRDTMKPSSFVTHTDEAGDFRIEQLEAGRAVLSASSRNLSRRDLNGASSCMSFIELEIPESGAITQDIHFCSKSRIVGEVTALLSDESIRVNLIPASMESLCTGDADLSFIHRASCFGMFFGEKGNSRFEFEGIGPGHYIAITRIYSPDGQERPPHTVKSRLNIPQAGSSDTPYRIVVE